MGIRFFCPNGHKMNVKSFLAGKRGICPTCGAKFEIPLESSPAAAPPVMTHPASIHGPIAESAAPQSPAEVRHAPASPVAQPTMAPFAPQSVASGVAPAAGWQPGAGGFAMPAAAPRIPQPIPRPATATPDPIAEAPTAVWYVRPAAGGQFGPAPGDMMGQWIDQRRVGADSMIWREGWTDWRRAAATFPSLAAHLPASQGQPTATAATAPLPAAGDDWIDAIVDRSHAHPAAVHHHRAKKPDNNLWLILSAVAIAIGIVLAALLIRYALKEQHKENPAPAAASLFDPSAAVVYGRSKDIRRHFT